METSRVFILSLPPTTNKPTHLQDQGAPRHDAGAAGQEVAADDGLQDGRLAGGLEEGRKAGEGEWSLCVWKGEEVFFPPCRRHQAIHGLPHARALVGHTHSGRQRGRFCVVNALFCVWSKNGRASGGATPPPLQRAHQHTAARACRGRGGGRQARRKGRARREAFGQRCAPILPFLCPPHHRPCPRPRPPRPRVRQAGPVTQLVTGRSPGGGRWRPRRLQRAHRAQQTLACATPVPLPPPLSPGHQSPQSRAACPTATAATCRRPRRRPASWPRLAAG